jgi:hypothetical protein
MAARAGLLWFVARALAEDSPRVALSVYDPTVVAAGDFVLDELRKLSDSGVYTTLTLVRSTTTPPRVKSV